MKNKKKKKKIKIKWREGGGGEKKPIAKFKTARDATEMRIDDFARLPVQL